LFLTKNDLLFVIIFAVGAIYYVATLATYGIMRLVVKVYFEAKVEENMHDAKKAIKMMNSLFFY